MSNLSDIQKKYLSDYLRNKHWENSPWLLIMDYKGRVWKIETWAFGNIFSFEKDWTVKTVDYYKDTGALRYFAGWNHKYNNSFWTGNGLSTRRDLNNIEGYDRELNNEYPSKDAGPENYYSEDDRETFKRNANQRIFTNDVSLFENTAPNSIAGYVLVSNDNKDFITMERGDSKYDVGFILLKKHADKNRYADDILNNHPKLVKQLLEKIYDLPTIKKCIANQYEPSMYEWKLTLNKLLTNIPYDNNKCIDYQSSSINVSDCSPKDTNRWEFDKKLIRNTKTGLVLDSNGSDIYMGGGSYDNPYQQWNRVGDKIVHDKSGKCLFVDANSKLKLEDCLCNNRLGDGSFREKYLDYLNYSFSKCSNNSEWSYDKTEGCVDTLNKSDTLISKKLDWCSRVPAARCAKEFLSDPATYMKYKQKLCSIGNNIVDSKIECNYELIDDNEFITPFFREEAKLYKKVLYYDLLNSWCANGNEQTKYACKYFYLKNIQTDNTILDALSNLWKKYNCVGDVPYPIYILLKGRSATEQEDYIKWLSRNTNYFARLICFTGEPLEPMMILLPDQSIVSNNRMYKLIMQQDGNLVLYKNNYATWASNTQGNANFAVMQTDGNLVVYNKDFTPIWASQTSGNQSNSIYLVIRNDGKLVLNYRDGSVFKILNNSPFENFDNQCDNSWILFIIICIILLLLITIISWRCINNYSVGRTSSATGCTI